MKKNISKLSLCVLLITLITGFASISYCGSISQFNTGDYVYFGKYLDEDILWKIVDFDEMNNPILLSEKILSYKHFDVDTDYSFSSTRDSGCTGAVGFNETFTDVVNGYEHGWNNWSDSDIRKWLNTTVESVYDDELGFLCNNNFQDYERNMIIPSQHRILGTSNSPDELIGENEYPQWSIDDEDIVENYNQSKYYIESDQVRLMSLKDVILWDKSLSIGFEKTPTDEALTQRFGTTKPDGYKDELIRSNLFLDSYWIDTPTSFSSTQSLALTTYDHITNFDPYGFSHCPADYTSGVVPVITIDSSQCKILSGSSDIENPLKLTSIDNPDIPFERPENEIGSYIEFGKYNDAPILWRIIDYKPESGYQLFSEYIICAKAYDARGEAYQNNTRRQECGSNYWKTSTIRQWLNSSDSKIQWPYNAPDDKNLNYNPYVSETGFLSNNNFSSVEMEMITASPNKTLINTVDITEAHIGTENQIWEWKYIQFMQDKLMQLANPESAYFVETMDKAYLLSYLELQDLIISRGWDYKAIARPEAETHNTYQGYNTPFGDEWYYYLRDGYEDCNYGLPEESSGTVISITQEGEYKNFPYHFGERGIRPCINISDINFNIFKGGQGTKDSPYKINY